jgi:hypothetical protein
MALSANAKYTVSGGSGEEFLVTVKDNAVIYNGALCSFDTLTGGIVPYATLGDRLAGFHFGDTVTGDTSATPYPQAKIHTGPMILRKVTVANLLSASSFNFNDLGEKVRMSDDGTFNVQGAGGASGTLVGHITDVYGDGTADVYVHNLMGRLASATTLVI